MKETWMPVEGYEGYYEISDLGVLRSVDRRIDHPTSGVIGRKGKVIKLKPHKDGYFAATLHRDGRRKNRMVHHLVLEAFVGPCPPGMECCHNNGDPSDNRVENLRWDTKKSNMQDIKRHGRNYWLNRDSCINGHPWDEENTREGKVGRECRTCQREKDRRLYREKNHWRGTNNAEKTHCKRGHEFTEENTTQGTSGRRHRKCKTCHRDRERERRARSL